MKKRQYDTLRTGCILGTVGFLFALISKEMPSFAAWYSTTIYPIVATAFSYASGWIPYSLSEVLLYACLGAVMIALARLGILVYRRKEWRGYGQRVLCNTACLVGSLFFLFAINCGANYYRAPFSEVEGIELRAYTVKELKQVSMSLAEQVNTESELVERKGDGTMVLPDGAENIAIEAMEAAAKQFSSLAGYYPRPKGFLISELLSYQNITGIYLPFTVEANYNSDMVDYNIPFTMCHELSHVRGFMQEEEANFIAYLACEASEKAEFRYSGQLLAFIYCTNVLYKESYEDYEEVRAMLQEKVEADIKSNREFWAKYDGRIAEVSNQVNDTYLKANGQSDGVQSYNRMVDLLVEYKKVSIEE